MAIDEKDYLHIANQLSMAQATGSPAVLLVGLKNESPQGEKRFAIDCSIATHSRYECIGMLIDALKMTDLNSIRQYQE